MDRVLNEPEQPASLVGDMACYTKVALYYVRRAFSFEHGSCLVILNETPNGLLLIACVNRTQS
jgi:hypothetical protein